MLLTVYETEPFRISGKISRNFLPKARVRLLRIHNIRRIIRIHKRSYKRNNNMATMNIRIDDDLKARSGAALDALGITTSEAVRLVLEYVAQNNRLPVQVALLADEDADIIELARTRLANPGKRIRVKLDDL